VAPGGKGGDGGGERGKKGTSTSERSDSSCLLEGVKGEGQAKDRGDGHRLSITFFAVSSGVSNWAVNGLVKAMESCVEQRVESDKEPNQDEAIRTFKLVRFAIGGGGETFATRVEKKGM